MIALDAALRGYKVALVEKNDFSSGTSSRSTNLLHGGVRYLENAVKHLDCNEYRLVTEALHERRFMLSNAPYITRPIATVLPVNSWFQKQYMHMGLCLYDFIAHRGGLPHCHSISWKEMQYLFPKLDFDWIKGGLVYYDGQSNDARLSSIITRTAIDQGATAVNYMEVVDLLHSPCEEHKKSHPHELVHGVRVRDKQTDEEFDIHAAMTVNATGPFVDSILKMYTRLEGGEKALKTYHDVIVPSKGVHLLLRGTFCPKKAGIVTTTSDGRVMFMLPWQN